MVTQASKHQVEEGMVGATAAMEVDGLGPVASDGEEALETVCWDISICMHHFPKSQSLGAPVGGWTDL